MNEYYKNIPGAMMDFEEHYLNIAKQLPDHCTIAEVGVAEGRSALFLAHALCMLEKTFTFYLIDSLDYGGKDQLSILVNNVIKSGMSGIEIVPYSSLDASCRFPDGHFDFVFIDASHKYEQTKADIRLWYRKVKEEGILAGHDYNAGEGSEVMMAVDEVIPRFVVRTDIPNRVFEPEKVLHIGITRKSLGIWWLKKLFYVQMK